jgi:hypothetical protein
MDVPDVDDGLHLLPALLSFVNQFFAYRSEPIVIS